MKKLLEIFKALSEETRLRILRFLMNRELCVGDIVADLNESQPNVSFHLSILKEAGFVKDRKQGKQVYYSLDGSDMFRRFLLLSLFERIPEDDVIKA